MTRQPIDHHYMREAGYDADTETLELKYKDGTVYQFGMVTAKEFKDFMASPLKTAYFVKQFRDAKPRMKVID